MAVQSLGMSLTLSHLKIYKLDKMFNELSSALVLELCSPSQGGRRKEGEDKDVWLPALLFSNPW